DALAHRHGAAGEPRHAGRHHGPLHGDQRSPHLRALTQSARRPAVSVGELFGPELAIAALTVVGAGLMRGFAGFGSAMLMAPIFSILFGPAEMVAIVCMIELPVGMQLVPGVWRQVEWRFVGPMSAAAVLLMPLGGWLLLTLPA